MTGVPLCDTKSVQGRFRNLEDYMTSFIGLRALLFIGCSMSLKFPAGIEKLWIFTILPPSMYVNKKIVDFPILILHDMVIIHFYHFFNLTILCIFNSKSIHIFYVNNQFGFIFLYYRSHFRYYITNFLKNCVRNEFKHLQGQILVFRCLFFGVIQSFVGQI